AACFSFAPMSASTVQAAERPDALLHHDLSAFNRRRLAPTVGTGAWRGELDDEHAWRAREAEVVERERAAVAGRAAEAPTDPDGFVAWFEALEQHGPGQHDPLFRWLAEEAPREAMIWFLSQEVAGEAGFDDLVAMTQVKLPVQAK